MIGIYKITNKVNNKCYIGQSIDIISRWRSHLRTSRNNKTRGYSRSLYKDIRKYGPESFSFEILCICEKDELNDKEIQYISKYNSYVEGYNDTEGADIPAEARMRPVLMIDPQTREIVRQFRSVHEVSRETGLERHGITNCCNRVYKLKGGYIWRFKDDYGPEEVRSYDIVIRRNQKKVAQYSPDGKLIKIFLGGSNEAAKETKLKILVSGELVKDILNMQVDLYENMYRRY